MKRNLAAFWFTLAALSGTALQAQSPATLKDAYKNAFLIGVAINERQFSDHDPRGVPIIQAQFNSITPENILKWESVHPEPDQYAFDAPDRYVAFGETNHMFIIGHTLVWHSQTPKWVFEDAAGKPLDREALLNRMSNHIHTVVGRYKGRIQGWDVVNEALNENGSLRQSRWLKIIGADYIAKAFQFAHDADPQAQLHYNDYSLENEAKRNGAIALIKKLQAQGIAVTAVGLQGHDKMDWPTVQQQDETIAAFAKLGVKVMITELDIDVNRATQQQRSADVSDVTAAARGSRGDTNGLPDSVQLALAQRYAELFGVFLKHRDVVSRVTFWGVTDGDSWLNDRGGGRPNHPLLFDRAGKPKPAFASVIQAGAVGKSD